MPLNPSQKFAYLLQDILEMALNVLKLKEGYIRIYEEDTRELVIKAHKGIPLHRLNGALRRSCGQGKAWECIQLGRSVINPLTENSIIYPEKAPGYALIVPLLTKDKLMGTISLLLPSFDHFQEKDLELFSYLGNQIGVALDNARLLQQVELRTGALETLYALSQTVNRSLNLEQILNDALDKIMERLRCHSTHVRLLDQQTQELVFVMQKGLTSADMTKLVHRRKLGESVLNFPVVSGEVFIVPDMATDTRLAGRQGFASQIGCRSVASLPLYGKDQILGLMSIRYREPHTYTDDEVQLFTSIGHLLGTAIENAGLCQEKDSTIKALQESEERFRAIFDAVANGIVLAKLPDRKIHFANASFCRVTGYSTAELRQMPVAEIFPAEAQPMLQRLLERQGARKTFMVSDFPILRKDGGIYYADIKTEFAVIDGAENLVGIFSDAGERKKAEEERWKLEQQIQQTEKLEALGLLAGGIAHDFNNLLGGIYGHIELAQVYAERNEQAKTVHSLSMAVKTFERARALTQQLLTFAKGGLPVKEQADMRKTVCDNTQFALSGSNVRCHFQIAADLWSCEYDPNQIAQVVENIVINAKHAMPQGGMLFVSVDNMSLETGMHGSLVAGNYLRITFRDQGIGIPKEYLPHIFDPFFTTKQAGSGLGLSTSYSIVKRHGGHIDAESEPGKGASFSIYLPAQIKEHVAPRASVPIQDLPRGEGRILLMDDEEAMREVAALMLSSLGYSVTTVENGAEALQAYARARTEGHFFSTVILDLTIPGGMGGKDTLTQLRGVDGTICAIASSGYSDDPIMAYPETYGFTASLRKPYQLKDIEEVVARCIDKRGKG